MKRNFKQGWQQIQKLFANCIKRVSFFNACILCNLQTNRAYCLVCHTCEQDLELLELGFDILQHSPVMAANIQSHYLDGLACVSLYHWPFSQYIPSLKFRAGRIHAHWMGSFMYQQLKHQLWPQPDFIVPMPLHSMRLFIRGYNQALLLANSVDNSKVTTNILTRVKFTKAQSGLNKRQRKGNVKDAFVCQTNLQDKVVWLIDDVVTTGQTVNEAARVLKQAGATAVFVAAVALQPLD